MTDVSDYFDHKERVRFYVHTDDIKDDIEILEGDTGFVVQPGVIPNGDRVLVQFDENKTGRAGGERHWIPIDNLESIEGEA